MGIYDFTFNGNICSSPLGTSISECTTNPRPSFVQPFSVNFLAQSPPLTYTPGGNFNSGTLNAFDVNVVLNGATIEHDGTGTFGFKGPLMLGNGSFEGSGGFTTSVISWSGSLNFGLGPSNDALSGAGFDWTLATCASSEVPPNGVPDLCFSVVGKSTAAVPEPGTAALAILGAAMLVAWRVLEKRHLRDYLRQCIGGAGCSSVLAKGPVLPEPRPVARDVDGAWCP
jgi:hypothetical protein